MSLKLNLDRGVILDITYPIGVKETVTFTYNDIGTLTDTFEVLISLSKASRARFQRIVEGANLSRATNVLTWIIDFDHSDLTERNYYYEIRNISQDYIEFKGEFKAIKTINTD